ncbi:MAG: SoxR reducing system RseC family protein [Acidaminococcus sp.]|nr:SoxR reducing system RseC family protein [Acidaminococcus sp.]MCI2100361.1 SoxR reducing system RseC family protein [Acidaminococcus sp.]MCI2114682.1 SoxR reducing system RseC family protein [Acidaminococcus sp.]MCI2116666.1 SoxR reducing system RseC family protein [Acidaminococcus sp.]
MTYFVGKVVSRNGQRATVSVERKKTDGTNVPRFLDCWNVCEAKPGARVRVERQTLDESKGKWIVRGIPILCILAGAAFGKAVSHYLPLNPWITIALSTLIWLLIGWNYAHTFARDVSHRGEQWSITGYYSEGEIPDEEKAGKDGVK